MAPYAVRVVRPPYPVPWRLKPPPVRSVLLLVLALLGQNGSIAAPD